MEIKIEGLFVDDLDGEFTLGYNDGFESQTLCVFPNNHEENYETWLYPEDMEWDGIQLDHVLNVWFEENEWKFDLHCLPKNWKDIVTNDHGKDGKKSIHDVMLNYTPPTDERDVRVQHLHTTFDEVLLGQGIKEGGDIFDYLWNELLPLNWMEIEDSLLIDLIKKAIIKTPKPVKKSFNVVAKSISYYDLHVEAYTEEEALEIGKNTDGGHFSYDENGSWDIVRASEVE
jgi:hypothetical protein